MATESLFNESYEDLLKRVRINTARDAQTIELINMTISEVRVGFYKKIGTARVNYIKTLNITDNPSSDEEILRKGAANIEVLWVMYLLMERLPSQTVAGSSASIKQSWNEEPVTRDANADLIAALKIQVQDGIEGLVEASISRVRGSSVGPYEDYIIGDTFRGCSETGSGWL